MTIVRAAISQTTWTGDKESMLDKHEQFARDAAAQGAQVMCFQELFYGPYFGITQDKKYYRYAEPADGPIVQRFAALAKELGMVMVLPIYEEEQTGVYYNTAVRGRRRRHDPRQVPQEPHPARGEVLGEVLLPPRQPGLPGLRHRGRQGRGCTSATTATSPRAGASSASTAPTWSSTPTPPSPGSPTGCGRSRGPAPRSPTATSCSQPNRVGLEDNEYGEEAVNFYGTSQVIDPRGNFVGERRLGREGGAAGPRPGHGHGPADARRLAVLPRPAARFVHRDPPTVRRLDP